jgi:isoaspartyl peptidase/L-asparaginase-like protein (Ntn-hydrolase superfamily)
MLRQGIEPEEACKRAIAQMASDKHLKDDMQVGIMLIRSDGAWATRSLRPGFQFAVASSDANGQNVLQDAISDDKSVIINQF